VGESPPVGSSQGTGKHLRPARWRRPRPRICLRKGCRRRYQPRCWNQRYCQEPECQRQVRRWQAARRQAKRRQDAQIKAQHAHAERARRQRASSVSQAAQGSEVLSPRGHAAPAFFLCPYAIGQAATKRLRAPFATRHASVATPAVGPFATSRIVSASGSGAAPWMAGRNGPTSTKPLA